MRIYLFQVYVLLTELISQCVYGQVCSTGFFGRLCKHRCHCEPVGPCDKISGTCDQGICAAGFFGPGCQFMDLVERDTEQTVPEFLRDSDDKTCNPNSKETSAEMTQRVSYPFSWYRIVVNDKANLLNFTTTLNDVVQCSNERKFKVSDTIVDVTCDITSEFQKLRIDGPVVGSICSIYLSGGRNVAAYQTVTQSTVDTQFNKGPSFAVDDNLNGDFTEGSCSLTQVQAWSEPWWRVELSRPYKLYSVRIINRDDLQNRMKGFKLETFNANQQLVDFHRDAQQNARSIYDVIFSSQKAAEYVKITQSNSLSGSDRAMTLCEVQTFGDAVCDDNTYRLECENTCSCKKVERCNANSGLCAPGCPAGYYGYNCQQTCNVNCLQHICEWITGQCLECIDGYTENTCNQACTPGVYVKDCKSKCSDGCGGTCSHINGTCTCKVQFTGSKCEDCSDTFYGIKCHSNCSSHCVDKKCNPKNGHCFTCEENYYGEYCQTEGSGIPWMTIILLLVLFLILLVFMLRNTRTCQVTETVE